MGTLVNSSFGIEHIKCRVFRMIKNVSADRFLSFTFGKYYLYNEHREQWMQNSLYVFSRSLSKQKELFFITYNVYTS